MLKLVEMFAAAILVATVLAAVAIAMGSAEPHGVGQVAAPEKKRRLCSANTRKVISLRLNCPLAIGPPSRRAYCFSTAYDFGITERF